ncbi:Hypothetical protein SRAE_0000032500 [Strongyloides ratti]|uniref:Uncharacterized protein n=1 Tax=Strongyloides ratti TaxID=34506 RepID=A0A090MSI2_STRRB|nr:Hypothetical protein SRAE_0000032500 [Strongyloides ratti]CEF61198.1 Hypothetical protein SRAE_0000032500 [Strongyloides ratti]
MYYNTIICIFLFSNFFYIFGQNINDPDYYPPQIDHNTDPIRRYLKLWSGILRNVAGDTEQPNYYPQNNYVRDYQQNSYQKTYNDYNQKPFENLLQMWKNKIEEITLAPKVYTDGIPLNQLKPNTNNVNNDAQDFSQSFPDIKNNNNDKEIINEMLLHKLLPRNKGDMYAFTSTTLKPSPTTTTNEVVTKKIKKKIHKKLKKKNTTKIIVDSTLPPNDNNIGKDYKVKVKIGPTGNAEETTTVPTTEVSTLKIEVEGSGEEINNKEDEKFTTLAIDSDEDDTSEAEEVHLNENNINKDKVNNNKNLNNTTSDVVNNNKISKNSNITEVEEKSSKTNDKDNDISEYVEEYSDEENVTESQNLKKSNDLESTTIASKIKEDYNVTEYSEEEDGDDDDDDDEEEEEEVPTTVQSTTTTTTTTTTVATTTTTKKNKKNDKHPKKEKVSIKEKMNKNNKNNKKKINVEKEEKYTIPEAEEEEDFLLPKHSYASQIDSLPDVESSSTTTKSPVQGQSVYNFYTNANANSTPNNSNTVVPVNTMVDGILPLLIPLLASRTPYLQNIFDNLASGVKTDNNLTPVKNENLISMAKNNKDNNIEGDRYLLSQVDEKPTHTKEDLKLINKKRTLDYISSVVPKQVSDTINKNNIQYFKTKLPENNSNLDHIPIRPNKL